MATTLASQVQELYIGYLGRAADKAGLDFWVKAIEDGTSTLESVALGFTQSAEYQAAYANLTNTQLVAHVYQNVLGRAADADGLTFWVGEINKGVVSADTLVKAMINSLGSIDQLNMDNKVQAANEYTQAAGGNYVLADAKTAIGASASSNPGQTYTLTAGADTVTGSAGDDTIRALTIDGTGAAADTLTAFDSIDGGAGNDTLNIYSNNVKNKVLDANTTVKNVENINIYNSTAAFNSTATPAAVDASKFVGATAINQIGLATAVTNLAATTTAGFKNVASTAAAPLSVSAAAGVASATVNLDGVKGVDSGADGVFQAGDNTAGLKVQGAALNAVTVTGAIAQAVTSTVAGQEATLALEVVVGKDSAGKGLQTVTVNSAVNTSLTVTDTTNTEKVTTVDASASTGAIAYTGDADAATIKTGAGADVVSVAANTSSTISASVSTGAGNDKITVDTAKVGLTSTSGTTTIDAGAGDDTVTLTSRSTGKLTANLGDGNDTFTGAGAVNGTDVIDGGAGTDTLALKMVGAANIGSFTNFEVFDTAGIAKALDVDILATKNTVTEFVASGDVGASASLTNIGAGIGFRATGDMTTNTLSLTQKTAGALTVTLDADSTSTTAQNDTNLKVDATNATSLKAVFGVDSGFVQTSSVTNDQTITLTGDKATSLEVVSGGTNATNLLSYTEGNDGAGKGLLTSLTITGSQNLDITGLSAGAAATQLATINASGFTGKLTADLADLKVGAGTLTLGSGADTITATAAGSNAGGTTANQFESIVNFSKAAAAAVGTDATAAATAQAAADQLVVTGATVTADNSAGAGFTISHGVLTFTGTGPSTLDAALLIADTATVGAVGNAVEFEYLGNSYVFAQGSTTAGVSAADTLVKLVGVTGVTNFGEVGTSDHLFIV